MIRIAPSVLGADFAHLGDEIHSAETAGADWFHLDIMDGHFVPNISFGPGIVKTINKLTNAFLDVHLMLSEPEKYFEPFINAGADAITFHIEIHPTPTEHLQKLNQMGVKTGLSLNPDCDVKKVLPYLHECDLLLVMSVFPGFGGQKFIRTALDTIKEAKKYITDNGLKTLVSVDGGVDADNADEVVAAGADILVMGSAFFNSSDRAALCRKVHGLPHVAKRETHRSA